MKILINYPKSGESGPAFSFEMAKGLKKNGHLIYAVLSGRISNATKWIDEFGEKNICWVGKSDLRNSNWITKLFHFIIDLIHVKLFFKEKIDLSIKPFYSERAPFFDLLIVPKVKTAICHDPIPHSGAIMNRNNYRKFYQNNDKIFVLTKHFIPILKQEYGISDKNIIFFPHGRMNMYSVSNEFDKLQAQYKKKTHLLFFGRIEKYKGLHVLAEAYKIIVAKNSDVELTILGSGNFDEYQEEYRLLPNVHIINRYVQDNEVGNYFALNHTISIVPYIDATQSGVIPIAYEFGTPVVASNQGGLREQLDDGKLGLLYDNNNPQKLAESIVELMENDFLFEKEKNKLLSYRESINWDKVTRIMLDGLKE